MDNLTRISKLDETKYQSLFGIQKPTFDAMLAILEEAYEQLHKQGGIPPKLSVLDKLVITLSYYREYRTMEHIGFDYDIAKGCIGDAVKWVENTLLQDGTFCMPGKRELANPDTGIEIIIIDATEQETERPQKTKAVILGQAQMSHHKRTAHHRRGQQDKSSVFIKTKVKPTTWNFSDKVAFVFSSSFYW
ncbi:MAG: transposase family protein [Defluviitaleaceae bacterium]|nr:transposase family protein [Defluviitaleaceae bacterium]